MSAAVDPEMIAGHGGWVLRVRLAAFDGATPDEQMANALGWAEFVDAPVEIDLEGARLLDTPVFGLPRHVTFLGRLS